MKKKNIVIVIITAVFLIGLIVSFIIFSRNLKNTGKTIEVFSGTGMSKPMSEIAEMYKKEKGINVNITFKSAGQSLTTMELTKTGCVYFPGSAKWFNKCIEKNIVKKEDIYDIAVRTPVIMVQKGNPKNIDSLEKLFEGDKNDLAFCLHDKNTTLGKLAEQKIFTKEQMDLLQDNIVSTEGTLAQVYTKISMGVADAGIGWLSYIKTKKELEAVELPEVVKYSKKLSIAPTSYAKEYKIALDFVKYIASEKGKAVFEKYGFKIVE